MQTLEFRAMNTDVLMAVEGGATAALGLQAARSLIEDSEGRFSRFLPDSEITQLNASSGSWHPVSAALMELLQQSRSYALETGGLFDPSILPDLKRIGYARSMDEIRLTGTQPAEYAWPAFKTGIGQIEIDPDSSQVRLPLGMELDLGGIAKGWIVEQAALLLCGFTTACAVSAGGDIVFKGFPADGSKWRIAVEDPREPERSIAQLQMGPGAVATSSVAKRTWKQGAELRHHLIDPRTGEPADTDWLSVTVAAREIVVAEVYAKALLIGGRAQIANMAVRHPEAAYLAVTRDGAVEQSMFPVELNEYQRSYSQ